jgi:hypothetical protein
MNTARILFVLLFLCVQIHAQQGGIKVITSAQPIYPPTAKAVGATGEVDVLAALNNDGDVISAEVFAGHPLFRMVSKDAVLKWKFEKNPTPDIPRSVVVAFYFGVDGQVKVTEKSEKISEDISEVTSISFSRVEMRFNTLVPKLLLLPREKGEIKTEKCTLHDEWMEVEVLPVNRSADSGITLSINTEDENDDNDGEEESYYDASQKYFPNARTEYYGNNLSAETEKVEVHYCKSCRIKRRQWLQEHNVAQ